MLLAACRYLNKMEKNIFQPTCEWPAFALLITAHVSCHSCTAWEDLYHSYCLSSSWRKTLLRLHELKNMNLKINQSTFRHTTYLVAQCQELIRSWWFFSTASFKAKLIFYQIKVTSMGGRNKTTNKKKKYCENCSRSYSIIMLSLFTNPPNIQEIMINSTSCNTSAA